MIDYTQQTDIETENAITQFVFVQNRKLASQHPKFTLNSGKKFAFNFLQRKIKRSVTTSVFVSREP